MASATNQLLFRAFVAQGVPAKLENPYHSVNEAAMNDGWTIPKGAALAVIGVLFTVVLGLTTLTYNSIKEDITDLKKATKDTTAEMTRNNVELVRAIGKVELQQASTNTRLDTLIEFTRNRR